MGGYRGSEKHTQYMNSWRSKTKKGYSFYFDIEKDKDIIAKLESEKQKTDYVRNLILQDIQS